jgi:seryl-tRNA synthetase
MYMIDIADFRARPDVYKQAAKDKGVHVDVDAFVQIDRERLDLLKQVEDMRSRKNTVSKQVPTLKGDEKQKVLTEMKQLSDELKAKEEAMELIETTWNTLQLKLPNLPLPEVPVGASEEENQVARTVGTPRVFDFPVKDHVALGKDLDIIDIEQAAVVSGSRFAYLKGDAVRLQMALVQLTFAILGDEKILKHVAEKSGLNVSTKPFVPMLPPVIMRREVMDRMDRLQPEDQRYLLPEDGQVLVGSAEHTLGPYYLEKTLTEAELPIRFIGYSTAFRREAGTYGKDMGGILRVHQFDKLEMESFTTAETGRDEQQFIVALQEYLVQQIEVPYRVLQKCTYDIGKPNANGLDIECWIPSQKTYRETHTSDYMTDFQARRLGTQYKTVAGKRVLVHMNDATAFAIGRALIAILENHQNADGSVTIPAALRPYMGGQEKIVPRT